MSGRHGDGGWVLIEVVASLVLLSVVLGVMFDAWLALGRRVVATEQMLTAPADCRGSSSWGWGPAISDASWADGPTLRVGTVGSGSEQLRVGLWLSGWFLAEFPINQTAGAAVLDDRMLWMAHVGEDAVLRVKLADGPWGPPWRTVVPGGHADGLGSSPSSVVVHFPFLSDSQAEISCGIAALTIRGRGSAEATVTGNEMDVQFGGAEQTVRCAEGRSVDFYF